MRNALVQIVRRFLQREKAANGRFLLGVSGGADSLALLHIMHTLYPRQLLIAHLDHSLRPDSAADAEFVRETAVSHHLPFFTQRVDVAALAQKHGWSIEEAGRNARYTFFAQLAAQEGITAVLVAHNADDQAETMLLHLLRGSRLRRLRGIAPVAPLFTAPHLPLLRPLLTVPRAEIEAYCRENGLVPRHDPSNQDTSYERNRVRHHLLPLLQQASPQLPTHLAQTAVLLAADEDYLQTQTAVVWEAMAAETGEGWVTFNLAAWRKRPLALRRRLLRHAFAQVAPPGSELGFRVLEAARQVAEQGKTGSQAELPAGVLLSLGYGVVQLTVVALPRQGPQLPHTAAPTPLPVPGEVTLANGWQLTATTVAEPDATAIFHNADPWQAFITLPATESLYLRPRQAGERMQPLGLNGRSTPLKKIMNNAKIPGHARPLWPLVATSTHPVWLIGHMVDERARVAAGEKTAVVHLRCWQPE
ncbi:MAG: tRNA lysidine(34) synthetase TilS [Ardenticatenaceae bacterium]|nr:tRNA lysidine(34) synthetase TilS [Ardenticatenaceae bacterium]